MQFSIWRFYSKYLSETEILEELAKMQKEEKIEAGDWVRVVRHCLDQDLKEKEKMCISSKSKNEEYKLRYKQVKDFSVKDLEEAGAYETAVLKILRDRKMYYDTTLLHKKWTEEREQYFDQDFSGVNGLVWLEKHGFIQKIEPEYIYAKDLKYGEYAVITEGPYKGVVVCVPYGTSIIMNISDANDTWESSDFPCRLNKISRPTIIVDPQN